MIYLQQEVSDRTRQAFEHACSHLHIPLYLFHVVPFCPEQSVPPINFETVKFVYATSSITDYIWTQYQNRYEHTGVFAHSTDILLNEFAHKSPKLMWNVPIYEGMLSEFYPCHEQYFIRPADDSKWMSGTVMTAKELLQYQQRLSDIPELYEKQILISEVKPPLDEYRLFFINYYYVAGSSYIKQQTKHISKHIPESVIQLAEQFVNANISALPSAFVLDVAESNTHQGVLEVNSINSSGIYGTDMVKVLDALCLH